MCIFSNNWHVLDPGFVRVSAIKVYCNYSNRMVDPISKRSSILGMQSSNQHIKPHSFIPIHVCVGEVLVEYPQHWPKPYMCYLTLRTIPTTWWEKQLQIIVHPSTATS